MYVCLAKVPPHRKCRSGRPHLLSCVHYCVIETNWYFIMLSLITGSWIRHHRGSYLKVSTTNEMFLWCRYETDQRPTYSGGSRNCEKGNRGVEGNLSAPY